MSRINFEGEKIFHKMSRTQNFSTLTKLLIKISGGRIKEQRQINYIFICISLVSLIIMCAILFPNNENSSFEEERGEVYFDNGEYVGEIP